MTPPVSDFTQWSARIRERLQQAAERRRAELQGYLAEVQTLAEAARTVGDADLLREIEAREAGLRVMLNGVAVPIPATTAPTITEPAALPIPQPKYNPPAPVAVVTRARSRPVPPPEPPKLAEDDEDRVPPIEAVFPELELAPPAPRPKLARGVQTRYQAFARKEREMERLPPKGVRGIADLKSLVCQGRAVAELAEAHPDLREEVNVSLTNLQSLFNRIYPGEEFFGFNPARHHPEEVWIALAEAYATLGVADEAVTWLRDRDDVPPEVHEALLLGAGAAEAWIFRLNDLHGLGFTDRQQVQVHARVRDLQGELYVPWWKAGERPLGDVMSAAKRLESEYREAKKRVESAATRKSSMDALKRVAESVMDHSDVNITLIPALREALDAGVRPSDKAMEGMILPYYAEIQATGDPALSPLLRHLSQRLTLLQAKHQISDEMPDDETPEDEITTAVRAHLAGKKVVLVGGRCIPEKLTALRAGLGTQVEWPDSKPDTHLSALKQAASTADVACFLVRWSRHSYKEVIDEVKERGGETVTLKGGIGVNRMVHDIYHQLVAPAGQAR